MKIVLFDTSERSKMYPLALTKALASLRFGMFTIQERWQLITNLETFVSSDRYLQVLYEEVPEGDNLWLNANLLNDGNLLRRLLALEEDTALFNGKGIIAARVHSDMVKDFSNLTNYAYKSKERIEGLRQLEHPFEIPQINDPIIRSDFILSTKNRRTEPISPTNKITQCEDIFVEEGALIEHSVLNASTGPIYIGKDAVIMEGCLIRGPFVMNEGAVLKMGTKVYGATTLGPFCTAGGEIKNVVMQGYSNKAHDGYLGDSVIGEWCNFGAGTTNSNVKNTGGNVKVFNEPSGDWINAGNKCGVIAGDYTRTAINTSINTGSIIGVCCNVFGEGLLPRYIPNFCWGGKEAASYEFDKAIKDIENWKKMKHQSLNKKETEVLKYIFEQSIK